MSRSRRVLRIAAVLACLCGAGAPAWAQPAEPAAPAPLEPIRALRQPTDADGVPDRVGSRARVAGRVTAGTGSLRADVVEVYLQDATGGLRLVLPASALPVMIGDSVVVAGTVAFREGMVEMVAPDVHIVPAPPVDVAPIRLPLTARPDGGNGPDLEGHEGRLVDVEGRVVQIDSTAGRRLLVLLSGTDLVQVYAYRLRASPVTFEGVGIGDYLRVRGLAVQHDPVPPYTGSYVVLPRGESDVRRAGLSPTEYKYGAIGIAVLLLTALAWARALRAQVRRRTAALQESEARYGHLFDAAADPVLVLDPQRGGQILEANQAAQRAFGVRADGARPDGRLVLLAELATDAEETAFHLASANQQGAASAVLEFRRPDGRAVPFEIATRRLHVGAARALVAVARDIEERRAYEHGLLQAIEAAEEAAQQAEEAARLKASILANMSHEIRTPLTAILGYADLLAGEVDPDLFDFADSIRTGGQRLLDTLNDILDYARLDAEQVALAPEPVNVVTVVRDAVAGIAPLAQRKGLGLHLQSERSSLPATLAPGALGRIVTILVGNAIKFTDRGEVRVSLHATPDAVAIRVQDTGVGITESFLPDLYEAFTQESDGHGRSHEGTGLGLAITKRLVDAMGGQIQVWSQKGEGTLFEVSFPTDAAPSPLPPAPAGDGLAGAPAVPSEPWT